MRQVEILPGELRLAQASTPVPAPGEALIKVHAAGVNRADVLQAAGRYPLRPGFSPIPGLEAAGVVEALGESTPRWRIGDPVCALLTGGGYAEYAAVPAAQCLPIPKGLDFIQAASLPETFFTVWFDVFDIGALKPGETLLVHGGSSGIGITAIQMAKALGSRVYVTAGSEEKCEACRKLGADIAVNYRATDFETAFSKNDVKEVDVILDMVGGSYTPKNLRLLRQGGRLVYINTMESRKAEVDLALIMSQQLTLTGSHLRPQPIERKAVMARNLEQRVWPLISNGTIRPVIDSVFPLADAAAAHQRMSSSQHIGKIVLKVI